MNSCRERLPPESAEEKPDNMGRIRQEINDGYKNRRKMPDKRNNI